MQQRSDALAETLAQLGAADPANKAEDGLSGEKAETTDGTANTQQSNSENNILGGADVFCDANNRIDIDLGVNAARPISTGQKPGRRGRPRNPDLPPPIGRYLYWKPNSGGWALERKNPKQPYEYLGFLHPADWEHLKGTYDNDTIIRKIRAVLAVKRLLTVERRKNRDGVGEKR